MLKFKNHVFRISNGWTFPKTRHYQNLAQIKYYFFTGILFKHPSKYISYFFSRMSPYYTLHYVYYCVCPSSIGEYQFAYYFIILMPPLDSLLSSHSPSTCIEALPLVNERYCKPLIGWQLRFWASWYSAVLALWGLSVSILFVELWHK